MEGRLKEPEIAAVLEGLGLGVVVVGPDGDVAWSNAEATQLLGVRMQDFVGQQVGQAHWDYVDADGRPVAPEDSPAREAVDGRGLARERVIGIRRRDTNERVWLRVTARRLHDDSGRLVLTLKDATAETLARHDLQDRAADLETRFQAVLAAMTQGLVVLDQDGSWLFANRRAREGLRLEDPRGYRLGSGGSRWSMVHADGSPLSPNELPSAHTRRTGEPVIDRIIGMKTPDRPDIVWVRIGTSRLDDVGPPYRVVATIEDVTDTLRSQREAEAARLQLQRVVDTLPGVIYQVLTDALGSEMQFLSGHVQDVLGVSREEFLRDAEAPTVHPDDRTRVRAAFARAAAHPRVPVEVDYRTQRDDQEWAWLRQRFVATPESQGAVVYTGIILDVSSQHAMEEHLRRSHRLDGMSSLAAGVAHNFNNMLGALIPNLESLLRRAPTELQPELQESMEAASSAAMLVRRLLQAVRGEPVRQRRVVDLGAAVDHVAAICRGAFDPGVELIVDSTEHVVPVRATPDLLHQVVLNLAINARDATAGTGRRRRVSLQVSCDDEQAWVTVSDNGTGMDERVLAHLGEPFFTTKPPGEGTGLGLATVYGIVADLDGSIEVSSTPGEGTEFLVSLPLAPQDSLLDSPSLPPDEVEPGRILLVDDEPLVRSAMMRTLGRMGHTVVEAPSGEHALELVDGATDLVLLDLSMPGLSGTQVLGVLKERHPDLPVVIVTGHLEAAPEDLQGADDVVSKPVGRGALERMLARHLSG